MSSRPASSGKRSSDDIEATPSSRGNKSSRTNSDSPCAGATNNNGFRFFNEVSRSILHHPLGIPLVAALNGKVLSLPASYPVKAFPEETSTTATTEAENKGDSILSAAYFNGIREKKLTESMEIGIKKVFSDEFDVKAEAIVGNQEGRVDLTFLPRSQKVGKTSASRTKLSTPLCVLEVGLSSSDWWKKFDQGTTYIDIMRKQQSGSYCFEKPLLLVIITLDDDTKAKANEDENFDFLMGVFLCIPKKKEKFTMSLIGQMHHHKTKDASLSFGSVLRLLSHFESQRDNDGTGNMDYKYFSSNCCKVDNVVLRSFDTRFRPSDPHFDLYLDPKCPESIVGGVAKTVLDIRDPGDAAGHNAGSQNDAVFGKERFWTTSPHKRLLVIATPFREGRHWAESPEDFLPIIEHLEKLHQAGYVHGDIRAFNTVFSGRQSGYLIDFDFSGKMGEVFYPKRYNQFLADGLRNGTGGGAIEKWHDWYGLGRLIFDVHKFVQPSESEQRWWGWLKFGFGGTGNGNELWTEYSKCKEYWQDVKSNVTPKQITELKDLLKKLGKKHWTITPSGVFGDCLEGYDTTSLGTKQGTTGSPPKILNP